MRRLIVYCSILFLLVTGVLSTPVICYAEDLSDQIAGEDERAASVKVGEEGMVPVTADQVKEGSYPIEVESSSSMFRIVKAQLTVRDGQMSAALTLGGRGYLKLFMGTGEEAVVSEESAYSSYVEDEDGAYTYTVAVEALNQELECTGFSKRKEKWYDHQILFEADTLPKDALLVELPGGESSSSDSREIPQAEINLDDGVYKIEVELTGGSGRASVVSPADIIVTDKKGTARIVWSSPHYDYMTVNGQKYLPVNEDGNSVFEIPVYAYDEEMKVIGDTTAMGTPHEIEYSLVFCTDSIQSKDTQELPRVIIAVVVTVAVAAAAVILMRRKKRDS